MKRAFFVVAAVKSLLNGILRSFFFFLLSKPKTQKIRSLFDVISGQSTARKWLGRGGHGCCRAIRYTERRRWRRKPLLFKLRIEQNTHSSVFQFINKIELINLTFISLFQFDWQMELCVKVKWFPFGGGTHLLCIRCAFRRLPSSPVEIAFNVGCQRG